MTLILINIVLIGGILVLFLIQNILTFCVIFWLLTWAGEYFFKKKNHKTKKNFYECGFKSTVDLNVQINFNFSLLCVFLILYDIEFMFLVPFYFNLYNLFWFQYLVLAFFIYLILFSLIYDWQMNALNWQI